jgi:hypothetical protein
MLYSTRLTRLKEQAVESMDVDGIDPAVFRTRLEPDTRPG